MRTRLQLLVACILLGILVAAGALLPARIAAHLDGLLLDKVEMQALAPDEGMMPASATNSLIGRLRLLTLPGSEVLTTRLETGERLNRDAVWKALGRELDDLRARNLYLKGSPPIDKENAIVFGAEPMFCVVPTKPNLSGIIWEVEYLAPELTATFYLDDESERIISYSVRYEGLIEELFTEQSGRQWLDYLGLDAENLQVSQEDITLSHEAVGDGIILTPPTSVDTSDAPVGPNPPEVWKRFAFTLPAKPSPLQFYCEQLRDKDSGISIVSITLLRDATWPENAEPIVVTP
jgi:hypothetical protein